MSIQPSTFENERCSDMELTATKEIIERLKAVKNESELTIPRIKDMMEKNGDYISLSTLRRVFADGSEEDTFSYDRTIAPIARALIFQDIDVEHEVTAEDRMEGLKQVILIKNEQIDILTDQVENLKNQFETLRTEYETRLNFLRDQIELKDKRMDEKDIMINKLLEKCLDGR